MQKVIMYAVNKLHIMQKAQPAFILEVLHCIAKEQLF